MSDDAERQRIDKWLWFARIVRTRTLAQELAASGRVRLNKRKVDAPAQPVRPGDVLTIGHADRVRIYRIVALAARRGSYPEALTLYDDLTPPERPPESSADEGGPGDASATATPRSDAPMRVRGEGRPTKRDRRRMDRQAGGGDGSEPHQG